MPGDQSEAETDAEDTFAVWYDRATRTMHVRLPTLDDDTLHLVRAAIGATVARTIGGPWYIAPGPDA